MGIRRLFCGSIAIACVALGAPAIGLERRDVDAGQAAMHTSQSAELASNKRLVLDMWRTVLIGRHVELADKFLAEDYRQHNPNIPSGRAALVSFVASMGPPVDTPATVPGLVEILAERDLVVLVFTVPATGPNPRPATWFDMFRVKNGKIIEHWDAAPAAKSI